MKGNVKTLNVKRTLPYILFALMAIVFYFKPIEFMDEIWNYNFGKNIADGMTPYVDYNIIMTPLSAYISSVFIWVFGGGMAGYKLAGSVLIFSIAILTYRLCLATTNGKVCRSVTAVMIAVYGYNLRLFIYNYNNLMVLLILIIMCLELKREHDSMRTNLAIGLLVGLAPVIKQNTGAFLLVANAIICAVYVVKFKKNGKVHFCRCAASAVPTIIFIISLIATGSFDAFWDYAIRGIGTFTHRITPIDFIMSGGLPALAPVVFAFAKIAIHIVKGRVKPEPHQLAILFFAVSWFSVTYPLCDLTHFVCVMIPMVPVYFALTDPKTHALPKCEPANIIASVLIPFFVLSTCYLSCSSYMFSSLNNLQHVVVGAEIEHSVAEVSQYIKKRTEEGYHVRVAGDIAALVKLPLDQYEKNWDLLLVGNVGSATIQDLLECDKPCLYLVIAQDPDTMLSQNHFEMIRHIKRNFEKVDEIGAFEVYSPT